MRIAQYVRQRRRLTPLVVRQLETKSRKATLAELTSIPLRLLIELSLRADQDIQSLSVDIQKLRETGRILAQPLNRVKKKAQFLSCFCAANRH